MITFDTFCKRQQMDYFIKEAFYHWLMSRRVTDATEDVLVAEWDDYLAHVMNRIANDAAVYDGEIDGVQL